MIIELNLNFEAKENSHESKGIQSSYRIAFKVEVVNCTEIRGNKAAERRFDSPPT
jgi:hypothetical protein